ncbi:MAG: DNA/RNA nuclease SfsA, partial [Alphaproteobacteria bacterium]
MQFDPPLVSGTLIARYKRFLADIRLDDGSIVTAHCVNPGAMADIAQPGNRVWLSPVAVPTAKLKWRWQIEEAGGVLVGVNTMLANDLAEEALRAGMIAPLAGYAALARERPLGNASRVDFLLSGPGQCFVEVKNVHWRRGASAAFPDSVTKRGAKHLAALADQVRLGHRAVILYIV